MPNKRNAVKVLPSYVPVQTCVYTHIYLQAYTPASVHTRIKIVFLLLSVKLLRDVRSQLNYFHCTLLTAHF